MECIHGMKHVPLFMYCMESTEIKAGRFSARSAIPGARLKGHLKRTAHKSESCTWRNVKGYQRIWWSSLLSLSSFWAQIKRTVMSVVVFVGPYLSCLYPLWRGRQCRHTCLVGHCVVWVLKGGGGGDEGWVTLHKFLHLKGGCVL